MHRILIADDEEDFRKAIAEVLRGRGYEVWECATVPAGMALLAEKPFEIVLSDLRMPGGMGTELLAEARRRWPAARLLVMSAYDVPAKALLLDLDLVVKKPFQIDDLVQKMESKVETG